MRSLRIIDYSAEHKAAWDSLVDSSRNGMFLFRRDYMEYHSDRFHDLSQLIFLGDEPVAVLPANIDGHTVFSHQGLTFGGLVLRASVTTLMVLEMFSMLVERLRDSGVDKLIYKTVPHIYHSMPSDDDLYALFRSGATLFRRDVSSAVQLQERIKYQSLRNRMIRKANKNGITVRRSDDYASFMKIVGEVLEERHGTRPVHTIEEIELLASRFPENIKLFASFKDTKMLGGVIAYESKNVAHLQYTASLVEGREIGALDAVTDYLLNTEYREKKYVDFGISTEQDGSFLNSGLLAYKEGFGARTVAYDFYELDLGYAL